MVTGHSQVCVFHPENEMLLCALSAEYDFFAFLTALSEELGKLLLIFSFQ